MAELVNPKIKAKSVGFIEEGEQLSRQLFERHFATSGSNP
jgi:hypothetical protein